MHLYIDESGVISPNKKDPFIITFLFIKDKNHKKIINYFSNTEIKIRKKYKLNNKKELKGWFYYKNNLLKDINPFIEKIIKNNKIVCVKLDNHTIKDKWLEDKVLTYNFMIKCGLERAYDSSIIKKKEELEIICDNRKIKVSKYNDIKKYIEREFNLCKNTKINSFKFEDSRFNKGIRIVDLVSFTIHGNIKGLNNINLKNVNFRKIY